MKTAFVVLAPAATGAAVVAGYWPARLPAFYLALERLRTRKRREPQQESTLAAA